MKRRAVFYIDGYNLYCALCIGLYKYIWLDLEKMCRCLIKAKSDEFKYVKYFTAIKPRPRESQVRQVKYINALKAHSTQLEVILGKFYDTWPRCKLCHREYRAQREKRTDVNIAVSMLLDALNDIYDIAYLITADSDQTSTILAVKKQFPNKWVGVWAPPGRRPGELRKAADFSMTIPPKVIKDSQLPDPVISRTGKTYFKPEKWETPSRS